MADVRVWPKDGFILLLPWREGQAALGPWHLSGQDAQYQVEHKTILYLPFFSSRRNARKWLENSPGTRSTCWTPPASGFTPTTHPSRWFQSVVNHNILFKGLFLWTSRMKSSQVKFMTRLNFDTHCEMNYRFYPFDKQVGQLEKGPKKAPKKCPPKNRQKKGWQLMTNLMPRCARSTLRLSGMGRTASTWTGRSMT